MVDGHYHNPRIDGLVGDASAADVTVKLDWVKATWVFFMLVLGGVGGAMNTSLNAVLLFVFFTAATLCFGHSLGMHRRFIHRSYRCPRWLEILWVHLGTLVGLAGPLGMLKTHDLRDWAQRQSVCHDYFSHGKPWYIDAYWQIFCSAELTRPPEICIEDEIADDWIYTWMERTWMLQQLPWALLFFLIGGWSWVAWGIGMRVSVSILGHWAIGYLAHNHGGRDWHIDGAAAQGFNIQWSAWLTMGECWHNNHHAFPGSAKLGIKPGQLDIGWFVLQGFEKVGLVSDLVTPDTLQRRDDLVSLTVIQ